MRDYAARKGFSFAEEYADDGYTGTNFNRPGFTRLMEDARDGKVNCVIVKDLSRMGRNYIEMGRLLTGILPSMGVRVIAINDNYDSTEDKNISSQIIVPFKNLINDAYCRDMSLKVRSQLDLKRRKGKFIGAFATYGYLKDGRDHGKLVIDETAGRVVEMIFNMKLDGMSTLRIVQKLNELQIPAPLEYKRICGENYNSGFRSGQDAGWTATAVNRILTNELYAGTLVQGKRRKVNYKVKKVVDVGRQDWVRVEGTHEAIVPRELFDATQRLMENDTRVAPGREAVYPLSGLVRCGTCGQNMIRRMSAAGGKKYRYYYCTTYKTKKTCTSHNVSEEALCGAVLEAIRKVTENLAHASEVLADLEGIPRDPIGLETLTKQMEEQAREIKKYENLKVKLYVDMTDGLISREEFTDLNGTFTAKMDALNAALRRNEKKKERKLSSDLRKAPWIEDFLRHRSVTCLDRRMAVLLLESVTVHDGEKIEVNFRHGEEIEEVIAAARAAEGGAK